MNLCGRRSTGFNVLVGDLGSLLGCPVAQFGRPVILEQAFAALGQIRNLIFGFIFIGLRQDNSLLLRIFTSTRLHGLLVAFWVLIFAFEELGFEPINNWLELLHALVVRLQEILHWLWLFLLQGHGLQSAVEFLDCGILEVSGVKVNAQIFDQKTSRVLFLLVKGFHDVELTLLLRKTSRLKYGVEVSDVVRKWEHNQLEAHRSVIICVLRVTREQSAETHLGVVSDLDPHDCNFLLSLHLVDEGIHALGAAFD